MSRQILQVRTDDELDIAIDYLKNTSGYNISLKVKQFLMKLYEFEKSKENLNNIV